MDQDDDFQFSFLPENFLESSSEDVRLYSPETTNKKQVGYSNTSQQICRQLFNQPETDSFLVPDHIVEFNERFDDSNALVPEPLRKSGVDLFDNEQILINSSQESRHDIFPKPSVFNQFLVPEPPSSSSSFNVTSADKLLLNSQQTLQNLPIATSTSSTSKFTPNFKNNDHPFLSQTTPLRYQAYNVKEEIISPYIHSNRYYVDL